MNPAVARSLPFVSIVMPLRNEAACVRRAIDAVLSQEYSRDLIEVIVVDGMSTDGTREILLEVARNDFRVSIVDNPRRITPVALNLACARTRGDVIVRVDGHCVIDKDYVRRCVDHLRAGRADGVGGSVQTIGETPVAQAIAVAMGSRFGVGGSAFRTVSNRTMTVDTIPFPAYTRGIMMQAGPYDEEQIRNQDDEYNYRLRELGATLLLAADVRSVYFSRTSLRRLARQFYEYGFWKVRVLQKHPRQMKARQFAPAALVGGLTGALLLWPLIPESGYLLTGIVGLYTAGAVVASCAAGLRRGFVHVVTLPVAFAIIHFSYGVGFLRGLVRFWNKWGVVSTSRVSAAGEAWLRNG